MNVSYQGKAPSKATSNSAAYDLTATHNCFLMPGAVVLIKVGFKVAIPPDYVGLISSRSGMALKSGLFVLNAPGIIDPDYRDEVGVILANISEYAYTVRVGDRVAQFLIIKNEEISFVEEVLGETGRAGGFGSTGV